MTTETSLQEKIKCFGNLEDILINFKEWECLLILDIINRLSILSGAPHKLFLKVSSELSIPLTPPPISDFKGMAEKIILFEC